MPDETKVAEAPAAETPKAAAEKIDETFIDNRRTEIENLVITENERVPETETPAPAEPEKKAEEKPAEESTVDRIKKAVQKRIDKVVAQKKSAEEELAEARAEIERLKAKPAEKPAAPAKPDEPPTIEQVEAYIIKMKEEGNIKEEVAATRYLIKLEKEAALKEVRAEQDKAASEEKARQDKRLSDWTALAKDYAVYDETGKIDPTSDLNLSNQKGLLYTTALALYNDRDLHGKFYNDPDVIQGFRRAVSDAYREIHQQGLIKTTPREERIDRTLRVALAEPVAETPDEAPAISNSLSDAEKVREEIKARNLNRLKR